MKKQEGTAMNPLKLKKLAAWILCAVAGASAALSAAPVAPRRATGAPTVAVSGTVTDGSGHGWPLYARIDITSASTDPVVVYSDPVTGAYAADLPDGDRLHVRRDGRRPGLRLRRRARASRPARRSSPTGRLIVGALCNAPGYGPAASGTRSSPRASTPACFLRAGASDTDSGASWQVFTGADPAGSSTGTDGRVGSLRDRSTATATATSSSRTTRTSSRRRSTSRRARMPRIQWANDFIDDGLTDSLAEVDVTIDGGATWTNVWRTTDSLAGPGTQTADMSFAAGHAGVQARFHYDAFYGYWWQVDDVAGRPFACAVVAGGLVVGNVGRREHGPRLERRHGHGAGRRGFGDDRGRAGSGRRLLLPLRRGQRTAGLQASADLHNSLTKNAAVAAGRGRAPGLPAPGGPAHRGPAAAFGGGQPRRGTQSLTLDIVNSGTRRRDVRAPRGGRAAARRSRRRSRRSFSARNNAGRCARRSPWVRSTRARRGPVCSSPSLACRRPPGSATS